MNSRRSVIVRPRWTDSALLAAPREKVKAQAGAAKPLV